jgi:hypothetical protein
MKKKELIVSYVDSGVKTLKGIGIVFFIIGSLAGAFAQKKLLTPELVIPGGYYNYSHSNLFQEKDGKEFIEGIINCTMKKEDVFKNLTTFIVMNKHTIILERENRVIFTVKQNAGTDLIRTPVSVFERSSSEVTFSVIIDYNEENCNYMLTDINVHKRLLKVNANYVSIAPEKDMENLQITAIDRTGLNIATKGYVNDVNHKRISALVAERNGYVNLVIKECKTLNRLKDKYVEKIKIMENRIEKEIEIYKSEYECVINFIAEFKKNVFDLTVET